MLAAGSYVTPGDPGQPRDNFFGNLIYDATMTELSWPMAATLSLVLFALSGFVTALYGRFIGLGRIYRG